MPHRPPWLLDPYYPLGYRPLVAKLLPAPYYQRVRLLGWVGGLRGGVRVLIHVRLCVVGLRDGVRVGVLPQRVCGDDRVWATNPGHRTVHQIKTAFDLQRPRRLQTGPGFVRVYQP